MSYKIVVDSCCELPEKLKADKEHFKSIPLTIQVDEHVIVDDESFNQQKFLKLVADSPNCPKSSCPSPNDFLDAYICDAESVFVVTLSDKLSGSFNSAQLAKNLFREEYGETKNIYVVNSKSASVGELQIAMHIKECQEKGMSFSETVKEAERFTEELNTYFVLETLETLRKNGRLSNIKAFVASALNIKPIMGSTKQGTICQLDQSRGMNKALKKMAAYIINHTENIEQKILAIAHCNCLERALSVKEEFLKRVKVKDVVIIDTAGLSSTYANDGGIIVAI